MVPTCELEQIKHVSCVSCSKTCFHGFILKHIPQTIQWFKSVSPRLANISLELLDNSVFYVLHCKHPFAALVRLVKQNWEFFSLAASGVTERVIWVSGAEGTVLFTELSVIKHAVHSWVNITGPGCLLSTLQHLHKFRVGVDALATEEIKRSWKLFKQQQRKWPPCN